MFGSVDGIVQSLADKPEKLKVLLVLHTNMPKSMVDLAKLLDTYSAALLPIINDFERLNLITKEISSDPRNPTLRVTPFGENVIKKFLGT